MKKHFLIYILPALLLLNACTSTRQVYLQVLMPAERNISNDVLNITLLDRSNYLDGEANVISKTKFRGADELDSIASASFILGLREVIEASPRYAILSQNRLTGQRNKTILSQSTIKTICDTIGCDGIVSLDDLDMQLDFLFDGSRGYLLVESKLNIRFYSLYNAFLQDSYTYRDTMYWENYVVSMDDIQNNFPSSEAAVSEAAYLAGWNYGRRIAPAWIEETRRLVTAPGKNFKQAYQFYTDDRLDEAISVWQEMAENSSGKKAANAFLNLAVAFEMKDDLQTAMEYANKSYFALGRAGVKQYADYLKERIMKKQQLQKQLQ